MKKELIELRVNGGSRLRSSFLSRELWCVGFLTFASWVALAQSCYDKAETQLELNNCAGSEAQRADKELNHVYRQLLKSYADDPKFIEQLKAAQRAWISFRDAELKMKYPHDEEPGYYGSAHPMCHAQYVAEFTRARTKQLRVWLKGIPEGDVCGGSVKQGTQLTPSVRP